MHFHGFHVERAWPVVFWLIIVLAAIASAAHAILA